MGANGQFHFTKANKLYGVSPSHNVWPLFAFYDFGKLWKNLIRIYGFLKSQTAN
jgi:hypothetical protein